MLANLVAFHEGQTSVEPGKKLVIVIEEVDRLIDAIHRGTITAIKPHMLEVRNKATFNTFLDDMYMYLNVILIMTSNTKVADIDAMDPSYLRNGRVHLRLEMNEAVV